MKWMWASRAGCTDFWPEFVSIWSAHHQELWCIPQLSILFPNLDSDLRWSWFLPSCSRFALSPKLGCSQELVFSVFSSHHQIRRCKLLQVSPWVLLGFNVLKLFGLGGEFDFSDFSKYIWNFEDLKMRLWQSLMQNGSSGVFLLIMCLHTHASFSRELHCQNIIFSWKSF